MHIDNNLFVQLDVVLFGNILDNEYYYSVRLEINGLDCFIVIVSMGHCSIFRNKNIRIKNRISLILLLGLAFDNKRLDLPSSLGLDIISKSLLQSFLWRAPPFTSHLVCSRNISQQPDTDPIQYFHCRHKTESNS